MPATRTLDPAAARVLRRVAQLAEGAPLTATSQASISRSTVVIGRMAEALTDRYHTEAVRSHGFERAKKKSLSWFAWLFHMLWGVVELLVPRSALILIFQYWIWFVLALGTMLILLSTLFAPVSGVYDVASVAIGLAAISGAVSGIVRRLGQKKVRRAPAAVFFVILTAAFLLRLATGDSRYDDWIPAAFFVWAASGGTWLSFQARSWLPRPHVSALLAIALGLVTAALSVVGPRYPQLDLDPYVIPAYVLTSIVVLLPGALAAAHWLRWHKERAQLAGMKRSHRRAPVAPRIAPTPALTEPLPLPRTPLRPLSPNAGDAVRRVSCLAAPPPDRLDSLYLFSRTLHVFGRMQREYFSHRVQAALPAAIWTTRAAFLLKSVTQAADPKSLGRSFFHHWFWLAFSLAVTLSALALIIHESTGLTRGAAILWTITSAAAVIVGAAELFVSRWRRWPIALSALLALAMGGIFLWVAA